MENEPKPPSPTEQHKSEEGSMDSTTQSQPGPNAGWQQPQTGTRPPLVRSHTDRKIAGVAGGLAAYLGVEPLWIRIAFVVISIPGGLGVLLYLLGWVLIPEEGEQAAIGEGLLEHLRRAPTWVAILLFNVAGRVYPALALLVVGAGLIVGALWGRSRLLILAGLLILPVAAAASLVRVPLRGGTGQRLYAPTTLQAVNAEYRLAAGQIHLDLTQLPWISTVQTRVRVAAGDIEVVVPSDVTVDFRGHSGAGEIDLFDVMRNGVDVTLQRLVPGAQPGSPRLVLDAEVSVGQIRVIRDEI